MLKFLNNKVSFSLLNGSCPLVVYEVVEQTNPQSFAFQMDLTQRVFI
jgi:hypothetical protein